MMMMMMLKTLLTKICQRDFLRNAGRLEHGRDELGRGEALEALVAGRGDQDQLVLAPTTPGASSPLSPSHRGQEHCACHSVVVKDSLSLSLSTVPEPRLLYHLRYTTFFAWYQP